MLTVESKFTIHGIGPNDRPARITALPAVTTTYHPETELTLLVRFHETVLTLVDERGEHRPRTTPELVENILTSTATGTENVRR